MFMICLNKIRVNYDNDLGVTKIYNVLAYPVKTTIQGAVYKDDIAVPMFLQLKLYANYLD